MGSARKKPNAPHPGRSPKPEHYRWRGKGTTGQGTGIADVFDPTAQVDEGIPVDDERRGKVTCVKCGEEVWHKKKSNGKFSVRNMDDTSHLRSCRKGRE